jgi:hypothetical protein
MDLRPYLLRSKLVSWTSLGEETVVVNLSNGYCYRLNHVAGFIWKLADGKKRLQEITKELSRCYNVESKIAQRDVFLFSKRLVRAGLAKLLLRKVK